MLSEPSALEARVRYATTDAASSHLGVSATPTEDYAATSGVLTFAAGETSKTIRVTVVADAFDEPDEFFAFRVSDPHNARLGRQLVVVEIEDDDTRGITLSEREVPVALVSVEEGNSKPIAAVLATQPTAQVTIRLELTGSTDVSVSPNVADVLGGRLEPATDHHRYGGVRWRSACRACVRGLLRGGWGLRCSDSARSPDRGDG